MAESEAKSSESHLAYTVLYDIYKNIIEQQKYAETKNNILFTVYIGLVILFIRLYFFIEPTLDCTTFLKPYFMLILLLVLIGGFVVARSFYPITSNNENKGYENCDNILFFEAIKSYSSKEFLDVVISKSGLNKDKLTNIALLEDLSNQVVVISKIVSNKYVCFKDGVVVLGITVLIFIPFFAFLLWR